MANGTDISVESPRLPDRLLSREALALCLIAAVLLAAVLGPDSILLLCFGGILALAPVPMASWLLIAYVTAIWGLSSFVDNRPIHLGPFSVYGTDAVALFLLWGCLVQVFYFSVDGRFRMIVSKREKHLALLLAAYVVFGLVSLADGLFVHGYAYDEVLGDYRRLFFYTIGMALPMILAVQERHLAKVKHALVVGGGLVLLLGMYRLITGTPVRVDYDSATGYSGRRLLLPSEISTLSLYVAYLSLVFIVAKETLKRVAAVLLAAPALPLLLMSGFRVGIAMALAVPLIALALLMFARGRAVRIRGLLVTAVLLLVPIAATPFLFPEQFHRMQVDMMVRLQSHAAQGGWRRWTWGAAFDLVREHPLLGVGIGHQLVFPFRSSEGTFIHLRSGVHNLALEIFYQTGILGLSLFVALHGYFIATTLRGLRRIPASYQPLFIALFVGYLSDLGAAMFQSPGVSRYVYSYLLMGLMLAFLRLSADPPRAPRADQGDVP